MNLNLFPKLSETLLSSLNGAKDILIMSHLNPDGDCVFSSIAAKLILEKLNKNITLVNIGPFSSPTIAKYENYFLSEIPEELLEKKPLLLTLDCAAFDRLGPGIEDKVKDLKKIVIDHHATGKSFTSEDLEYIVPASPSNTLLIEQLRIALNVETDYEIAKFLYMGFATDTGFYHFITEENGADSLRVVADFVSAGVSPYDVYDELTDGRSFSSLEELSELLKRVKQLKDGKVLYTYKKKDDDMSLSSTGILYKYLLEVENVKLVLFFKEKEDSTVVGFRAKNKAGLDVGKLASVFTGGGHRLAAGATVKKGLDETIKDVLDYILPIIG